MHWKYTLPRYIFLHLLVFLFALPMVAQEGISYASAFPDLSFEFPVEIQHAADGSDRLFVLEQRGRIKVFRNAAQTTSAGTFLDITDIVSFSSGQEIGLLGLAFHPNFTSNGYFYVYHTRRSSVSGINVELVLARYRVSANNPNRADPASRLEIFSFDKNQRQSNHNGGKIAFGPDGYLYASIGDGGGGGDPVGNAQNLNTVFGSIFRIDVDVDGNNPVENNPDAPNGNYEIPSDNPRVGKGGLDELYAWGVRNTWKFSFDNATGRLWGGDVGQGEREEINLIRNGGNYGWNRFEGNSTFRSSTSLTTSPDIKPVHTYDHNSGDVSITLGYVYRGKITNSAIKDKLIFGDYVSGRIWALAYDGNSGESSVQLLFRTAGQKVSSFGLDEAGELYFSDYKPDAKLYRFVDESEPEPTATAIDGIGAWQSLQQGVAGTVAAVVGTGNTVYASGSFSSAGGVSANNIATYTEGRGWSALSAGANGRVSALALDSDGLLYAGGDFTSIGGTAARNIAVWDGSNWKALGVGTDGPVLALKVNAKNELFVGGAFAAAGGVNVNNIARWTGSWSALTDTGTRVAGTNNEVRSIAFDENDVLYVGGNFASAGNRTANRIATFSGGRWGTLGTGTSGFVQAIAITATSVYVGGNFDVTGGQTVNRIARWDRSGSKWEKIGQGVSGNVNALVYDSGYLYVGGNFATATTTDGQIYSVNNAARWSPADQWEALGEARDVGTDNQINTLSLSANADLYVGGSFVLTGNSAASGIARWRERGDCSLIPYTNINRRGWDRVNSVVVDAGDQVGFGPQSTKFRTTNEGWSWSGPDNFTATGRELLLDEVRAGRAGEYTVTNTDPDGCTATLTFTITIRVENDDLLIKDGAVFELQPRHRRELRLDVEGSVTRNGTAINGIRRSGGLNQQWRFISRGDNVYEIAPLSAPEKRLDVARVSTISDTEVHLWARHGRENQQWRALPVGDGTFRFAPLHATANRLDIKRRNGIDRGLSSVLDSGNSQRWRLIPVPATASTMATTTTTTDAVPKTDDLIAEFKLYPNPASDLLTIESAYPHQLFVYDITGRQLIERRYPEGRNELDVSQLPAGTYVVRLTAADHEPISRQIIVD